MRRHFTTFKYTSILHVDIFIDVDGGQNPSPSRVVLDVLEPVQTISQNGGTNVESKTAKICTYTLFVEMNPCRDTTLDVGFVQVDEDV